MIVEFVKKWDSRKSEIESFFKKQHPGDYKEIVEQVISILENDDIYGEYPSKERIHQIDDGDYQGTLLFVIGASGYQPRNYWYVMVDYGSCSACDTLQAINGYSSEPPTEDQVSQYMQLALNILQELKSMQTERV